MNQDLISFITCFCIVSGVVAPIGFVSFLVTRRSPIVFCKTQSRQWNGFEALLFLFAFICFDAIFLSFVIHPSLRDLFLDKSLTQNLQPIVQPEALCTVFGGIGVSAAQSNYDHAIQIANLWSRILAAILLTCLFIWLASIRDQKNKIQIIRWIWSIRTASITWFWLAPIVLFINFITTQAAAYFNLTPDVHPLSTLGTNPKLAVLLFFSACLATPVMEELLVRGVFLPWAAQDLLHSVAIILLAVIVMVISRVGTLLGPLTFFGILILGFWLLLQFGAAEIGKKRKIVAIYSTSVFFAMAHTSVWPTPVPLFFFALGLGWLAMKTGSVTAPIFVHGLLNAVSALYVLRGGAM